MVTVGQTPRHPLLCAMASPSVETSRIVLSLVLDRITQRDEVASVIPAVYRTCTYWRKELSDEGFHMRTFALCTSLSDVAQTFERAQALIRQQLERVPDEADRAWWLDARSLVQRCRRRVGSGTVWSWLQQALQEPDGPLSRQAAAGRGSHCSVALMRQRYLTTSWNLLSRNGCNPNPVSGAASNCAGASLPLPQQRRV